MKQIIFVRTLEPGLYRVHILPVNKVNNVIAGSLLKCGTRLCCIMQLRNKVLSLLMQPEKQNKTKQNKQTNKQTKLPYYFLFVSFVFLDMKLSRDLLREGQEAHGPGMLCVYALGSRYSIQPEDKVQIAKSAPERT